MKGRKEKGKQKEGTANKRNRQHRMDIQMREPSRNRDRAQREMQEHQYQIETDVPKLGRVMVGEFEEGIELDAFVGTFRGSTHVIHGFPNRAATRGRSIEANVGIHRDRTGSAKFGIGARIAAGANAIIVQRTAKFGILATKVIAVGLHFEASGADGNTVRANGDAMKVRCLFGIAQVEIDVRGNVFALAEGIHGHGVVSRVKE